MKGSQHLCLVLQKVGLLPHLASPLTRSIQWDYPKNDYLFHLRVPVDFQGLHSHIPIEQNFRMGTIVRSSSRYMGENVLYTQRGNRYQNERDCAKTIIRIRVTESR